MGDRSLAFELLSHLWLHEPDADTIARAVDEFGQTCEVAKTSQVFATDTIARAVGELGLPAADPAELALAYADVFLLNVYPYGTAFADPSGELNGPEAQRIAALYETDGYCPPELNSVGAPDHLGLCLGFLAHLEEKRLRRDDFLSGFLEWAPVCCLAVEREPAAHLFYRALAALTRDVLLKRFALRLTQHRERPSGREASHWDATHITHRLNRLSSLCNLRPKCHSATSCVSFSPRPAAACFSRVHAWDRWPLRENWGCVFLSAQEVTWPKVCLRPSARQKQSISC